MPDGLFNTVGDEDQVEIGRGDCAVDHHAVKQVSQGSPVDRSNQDHGKVADLPGLHEREGLEQLVDRADAARQHDERIGVLDEQDLTNEEVMARDASIKIPVRPLLKA